MSRCNLRPSCSSFPMPAQIAIRLTSRPGARVRYSFPVRPVLSGRDQEFVEHFPQQHRAAARGLEAGNHSRRLWQLLSCPWSPSAPPERHRRRHPRALDRLAARYSRTVGTRPSKRVARSEKLRPVPFRRRAAALGSVSPCIDRRRRMAATGKKPMRLGNGALPWGSRSSPSP